MKTFKKGKSYFVSYVSSHSKIYHNFTTEELTEDIDVEEMEERLGRWEGYIKYNTTIQTVNILFYQEIK